MPAATGISLRIRMETGSVTPTSSESIRAARSARLLPSVGTWSVNGPSTLTDHAAAVVTDTSSKRPTAM